jgi:catechol 2,3-dioxygenase-like lactoylglutathione lyase family enzyme
MSLQGYPLLYVFLESSEPEVQRQLFEQTLGLELIEIEPHLPHHRHGIVKYDASNLILSLNEATPSAFRAGCSDGLVMVFDSPTPWRLSEAIASGHMTAHGNGLFTDQHGHHYLSRLPSAGGTQRRHVLAALRLGVPDVAGAVSFYQSQLGLDLVEAIGGTARFATGSAMLELEQRETSPDGKIPRPEGYLIVFYSDRIEETFASLVRRGVPFKGGIAISEIGRTIRFQDPAGHRICVYQPSAECLEWGSGAKVLEIAAGSLARQ